MAERFGREPGAVDPVHQVKVAHLVLHRRTHSDFMRPVVVHGAAGGDGVPACQGHRLVSHRVEHLGQLRVVLAQECPLHVWCHFPARNDLS